MERMTTYKSHNLTHLSVSVLGSWFLMGHLAIFESLMSSTYLESSVLVALIVLSVCDEVELTCKEFSSKLHNLLF